MQSNTVSSVVIILNVAQIKTKPSMFVSAHYTTGHWWEEKALVTVHMTLSPYTCEESHAWDNALITAVLYIKYIVQSNKVILFIKGLDGFGEKKNDH